MQPWSNLQRLNKDCDLVMLKTLTSVTLVKLPRHFEENGDLVVMENLIQVPFSVARVFVVRAPSGAIRGQHAHKAGSQFMNCPAGEVEIACDDGNGTATYVLDDPGLGLYMPPGIWAQQLYRVPGSI